jgi:endonuclease YncB( thermonuclease family)
VFHRWWNFLRDCGKAIFYLGLEIAMSRRLACLLALLLGASAPAAAEEIRGKVGRVLDGDTFEVAAQRIRIQGLHAPELEEPLGPKARDFVRDLVKDDEVRCIWDGERSYNRLVARCFLDADGRDIAAELVAAGLGRDCARYSGGRYAEFETEAGRELALPTYCAPR